MFSRRSAIIFFLVTSLIMGTLLVGCTPGPGAANSSGSPASTGSSIPTIDNAAGQALFQAHCQQCHALSRVTSKTKSAADWKVTVDRMIARGANLTPQEEETLIQFLAANY